VLQVSALGTTIPASPYIGPENLVYVSGKARVSDVAAMVQVSEYVQETVSGCSKQRMQEVECHVTQ
jgi:hypothetical protein